MHIFYIVTYSVVLHISVAGFQPKPFSLLDKKHMTQDYDAATDDGSEDGLEKTFLTINGRHLDLLHEVVKAELVSDGRGKNHGRCDGGWVHGPIIIGGLSDSGTRGAKFVINDLLNIPMQTEKVGKRADDRLMNAAIGLFWTTFLRNVNGTISNDMYSSAAGFHTLANDLCQAVQADWELAGKPLGTWGFKSPRSILMTPVWNYMFGDNYRFVHVVRDPRAVCANSANKIQYQHACEPLLSSKECEPPQGCFNYWTKVNGDVHKMFTTDRLGAQYVFLSMDRLVLPEPVIGSASFDMVRRELAKLPERKIDDALALEICATEHDHARPYMPSQFKDRQEMETQFRLAATNDTMMSEVALLLGYNTREWGIADTYDLI